MFQLSIQLPFFEARAIPPGIARLEEVTDLSEDHGAQADPIPGIVVMGDCSSSMMVWIAYPISAISLVPLGELFANELSQYVPHICERFVFYCLITRWTYRASRMTVACAYAQYASAITILL